MCQIRPTCLGPFPHFFHGGQKSRRESETRKGGVDVSSASPGNLTDLLLPLLFSTTVLVVIMGLCILVPQATIPPIPHPTHYMCTITLTGSIDDMFLMAETNDHNQCHQSSRVLPVTTLIPCQLPSLNYPHHGRAVAESPRRRCHSTRFRGEGIPRPQTHLVSCFPSLQRHVLYPPAL